MQTEKVDRLKNGGFKMQQVTYHRLNNYGLVGALIIAVWAPHTENKWLPSLLAGLLFAALLITHFCYTAGRTEEE